MKYLFIGILILIVILIVSLCHCKKTYESFMSYDDIIFHLQNKINMQLGRTIQHKKFSSYDNNPFNIPICVRILDRDQSFPLTNRHIQEFAQRANDLFFKSINITITIESVDNYIRVRNTSALTATEPHPIYLLPETQPYCPHRINVYFVPSLGSTNVVSLTSSQTAEYLPGHEFNTDANIVAPPLVFISPRKGRLHDPTDKNWDLFFLFVQELSNALAKNADVVFYDYSDETTIGYEVASDPNILDVSYSNLSNLSLSHYSSPVLVYE
jgi:hypothetical protein